MCDAWTKRHRCDAECIIEWLDNEVRIAFRERRRALGLGWDACGVLILDAGPHHLAKNNGEADRREQLCKEMDIHIVYFDPGASAHGQSMDQIHHLLSHFAGKHERLTLCFYDNVYLRCDPGDIKRTEQGRLPGLTNRQAIEGDLWAIDHMPPHMWLVAWYLSGYITDQEMNDIAIAKWGMEITEAKWLWRALKKQIDATPEDQIDLKVASHPSGDNTPFQE